jgi:hypothetical protein
MANTIDLVSKYLADPANLNAVYKAASLTADLEAAKVQFVGANVVKLPTLTFGAGLGTYNRDSGYTAMDVTKAWTTYTLSQDKGNSLLLDAMDEEESAGEGAAAGSGIISFVNEYIRQVVVPAIDTYRFAAMVEGTGTTVELTLTAANVVAQLEAAFETFATNEVPVEGAILYMLPSVKTFLQTASTVSRYVSYGTGVNGQIDNRVMYYNGARIIEVPASRLGADVQFILVQPKSVLSVVKHNPSYFFGRGTHPGKDADIVDYRLYYDFFVIANKNKGIYLQTVTE